MSEALYIPAIGEQFNSVWHRKLQYKGKDGKSYDMKFFTKDSHFEHNIGLQSCWYGINGVGKRAKGTFRDMIGFPKDKIFMADSAGFQVASFQTRGEVCNIKPIDSLRWQEENADVGFNLDYPPTLGKVADYKHFKWSLNESVKNFQFFQDNRKNPNLKLMNVLHGETLELMEEWYNAVKDFKFDGWAVGLKPPFDPMIQAMGFMFLYEKGEFKKDSCKWLHFFGTTGKHVVPTLVYAASKLNDIPVSYDSSSYNIGSIFRTYYLPFDIGPHLAFGDKFSLNSGITKLPCLCPVCRTITNVSELNTKDIYAGTLISLHNMYQYVDYNNVLNRLVNIKTHEHEQIDESGHKVRIKNHFIDYLKKINISKKTLLSLEFIDFAMKHNLKAAVDRYGYALLPQETNKTSQTSIFSFEVAKGVKTVKEEQKEHFKKVDEQQIKEEEKIEEGKLKEIKKEEKPKINLSEWGFK